MTVTVTTTDVYGCTHTRTYVGVDVETAKADMVALTLDDTLTHA